MKKLDLVIGTANWSRSYGSTQGGLHKNIISKIKHEAERLGIIKLDSALAYTNTKEQLEGRFKIQTKINSSPNEFRYVLEKFDEMNLDALLMHDGVKIFENPELLEQLYEFRQSKGVLLGISLYFPDEIYSISDEIHNFDIIQFPFNLVDQRFSKVMSELRALGWKGIFQSRSVFLQGYLLERDDYPASFGHMKDKLNGFKREHSLDERIKQSLLFVSHSEVDELVLGVNSEAQLTMIYNSLRFYKNSEIEDLKLSTNEEGICVPFLWR